VLTEARLWGDGALGFLAAAADHFMASECASCEREAREGAEYDFLHLIFTPWLLVC
jgi:hypothetical protein